MPRDPLVHFPAFRHHEDARQEANNAMMALLVGAQVSAQFLELSRGSSRLLSEIFPAIAHIKRLDLKPDSAQLILRGAEEHLGAMAVPQALAIHEGFIMDCLELLLGTPPSAKAFEMHQKLAQHSGSSFDADSLSRFHVLREMRNSVIHRSGIADHRVIDQVNAMTPVGASDWRQHAGRAPHGITVGDTITLLLGELVVALATTKALARQANRMLITAVAPERWADVIVADHLTQTAGGLNSNQHRRAILGLRRFRYSAVAVSDSDLEAAAAARGIPLT